MTATVFTRRLPGPLRPYNELVYVVAYVLVLVLVFRLARYAAERDVYKLVVLLQAAGLFTVPLAFRWCRKLYGDWQELLVNFVEESPRSRGDAKSWLANELRFFDGNWNMFSIGVVLGILGAFLYDQSGFVSSPVPIVRYTTAIVIGVSAAFAGMGLYAVICGGRTFNRFGRRFTVRLSEHKYGVLSTGTTLTKLFVVVVGACLMYMLSAAVTETLLNLPMLLIALPVCVLLVSVFIWCQYPLHLQMKRQKITRLHECDECLDQLRSVEPNEMDEERRQKIEYFQAEHVRLLRLPEWPFSTKALTGASFVSFLPLLMPIFIETTKTFLSTVL